VKGIKQKAVFNYSGVKEYTLVFSESIYYVRNWLNLTWNDRRKKLMHLITYISDYTGDAATIDHELRNIVSIAKEENPKHGITGVLFYHKGNFVQVIEGEEEALRSLMVNLENDSRHKNIEYLMDEPITARDFSSWNMDYFNLSDQEQLNVEELRKIAEIYKRNFNTRSERLVFIYKTFLEDAICAS